MTLWEQDCLASLNNMLHSRTRIVTANSIVTIPSIFEENEKEKKKKYQQRLVNVEMGSLTPCFQARTEERGKDANFS